jgi:hypothetical protein
MPNYVYSTLALNGSSSDIKAFRTKFEEEGKLDANKVIPYPRDLDLLDKKSNGHKLTKEEEKELTLIALEGKYDINKDGYNQGGYNWNIDNWGTKWNFCDCRVEDEDKSGDNIVYDFSTAWSPITPIIIKMSEEFPNIVFDYFCDEESGDFRFEVTYENGIKTYEDDRTHECEEEQRQREEDYKLEEERNKKIEEQMEKEEFK